MQRTSSPIKMAIGFVFLLAAVAGGFWWLKIHDYSVRFAIDDAIAYLRAGGPWLFFMAMAILPAIGFPISIFNLTAASAFAAKMSLPGVVAAASAALAVNVTLSYWLARYGLRPWLEEIIGRTKYKIPEVSRADSAQVTLLVRITPGPPFFLQSYLLGLAEVPFGMYLTLSWLISTAYATAFIVFGEAILQGRGKAAFFGFSALLALGLIVHLLRRHYGKKGK